MSKSIIILGVDPGLANTGYGVISTTKGKLKIVDYGCIITKSNKNFYERLKLISNSINNIIKKFKPHHIAIEEIFFYKNVKTALKVGQAKGAIILTCQNYNIPMSEFTPLQVKQALTGYGRADKRQIQLMVKILLHLKTIPKPDDAADALAVAICCAHSTKTRNTYNKFL